MNSRRKIATAVVIASLAGVLLAGCSMDRWVEVQPGVYTVVHELGTADPTLGREVQRLEIDRDGELMVFTLVDGSEIVTLFVSRERTEWPAGCPTNIQSTRMEVLDIAEDPLSLGSATVNQPILVRDCPRDPVRLVLREDGVIGGGSTACPYGERCLYFAPESTASAAARPLPHSAKGYELYSWETGQGWHFTLITGTNRLKTYDEMVSTESVVTESEWVTLSARGIGELTALLSRLPRGETVTWIGGGWLERVGAPNGNLRLPSAEVLEEMGRTCRNLGIELQVAD